MQSLQVERPPLSVTPHELMKHLQSAVGDGPEMMFGYGFHNIVIALTVLRRMDCLRESGLLATEGRSADAPNLFSGSYGNPRNTTRNFLS